MLFITRRRLSKQRSRDENRPSGGVQEETFGLKLLKGSTSDVSLTDSRPWKCAFSLSPRKNCTHSDLAWNLSDLALRGTKVSPLPNTDVSASVRCISDGIVTTSFVVVSAFGGPLASGVSVFVPVGLLRTPKPGQPKRISFLFLSQINWRCNREFNSWIKCLI